MLGILLGVIVGFVIAMLISGVVFWIVSAFNLGIKVESFSWAMVAGVLVGMLSSIFQGLLAVFSFVPEAGFWHGIWMGLATVFAILVADKWLGKHFKARGFFGAVLAVLAIGVLGWMFSFFVPREFSVAPQDTAGVADTTEKDPRVALLANWSMAVPDTDEVIYARGEGGEGSFGYVVLGKKALQLEDGATLATVQIHSGGNAYDTRLVLFVKEGDVWVAKDTHLLGETSSDATIDRLLVDAKEISVGYRVLGSHQAQSEDPSDARVSTFVYEDGKLTRTSDDAPREDVGPEIAGTSWAWQETRRADGTTDMPKEDAFVITFSEDGSFSSTTDCNRISGGYGYNSATGQIVFDENMAMTMMACADSMEQVYVGQLMQAETVMVEEDVMQITLRDGSVMVFTQTK